MRGGKIDLKKIDITKLMQILDKVVKNRENKRGRSPKYRESLIYFSNASNI